MNICLITANNVNDIWQNNLNKIEDEHFIIFGFNGLGVVSYKKELAGETEYFQDLANFSKQNNSLVISGVDTDNFGIFRHSVVVAEYGKILGVSDSVYADSESEFSAGGSCNVYNTHYGKIGIIIDEDIFFPDCAKTLSMLDVDIIVCIYKKIESQMPIITARSLAFCYGTAIVLVANNKVTICDDKGDILLSDSREIVKAKLKINKQYTVVSFKKKGKMRTNENI